MVKAWENVEETLLLDINIMSTLRKVQTIKVR
jgi:hypothetical protein